MISKIETGERPPAEDFPPRLDAVPGLDTRGALTRLRDHLNKGHKQRLYGWFQQWAGIEAQATVLRWYEPLVVPGLLQTEEYARVILSARPDGNLDDLDEQVAARLARQAILGRTGAPQLWCILDEGVLHRAIGGSKVMRSQLYRLAEVAFDAWRKSRDDLGEELSNVAIYLLGLAEMTGIDLQDEIEAKMAKNATRGYQRLPNGVLARSNNDADQQSPDSDALAACACGTLPYRAWSTYSRKIRWSKPPRSARLRPASDTTSSQLMS